MALTFPSTPTNGQVYLDTNTGNRYIYNSNTGAWAFSSNNVGMSVSSTPPGNIGPGSMWFNREIGRTFVYYNDGDSSQWVETVPSGSIDTTTIASYVNPIYASLNANWTYTNTAYTFANIAVNTANTAFPNTPNVSFNGSFNVPNGAVSIGTNAFPVGELHVLTANGEISRFTATGASGGYHVSYFDNSTPWYFGSAKATIAGGNINDLYFGSGSGTTNNLIFGTAGTERVRIDNTGNVGIGTTNAGVRLDVVDNSNVPNGQLRLSSSGSFGTRMSFVSSSANGRTWQIGSNFVDGIGEFSIYDQTAAANRMRIDSGGRVTMPSQPAFHVYRNSSGGAQLNDVNGVVIWNTVVFNTGGHYNTSTGRFTAPVAGRYMFNVRLLHNGTAGYGVVSAYLRKNTGNYPAGQLLFHNYASWITCSNVVFVELAVGDYVDVNITDGTWHDFHNEFSGMLIG